MFEYVNCSHLTPFSVQMGTDGERAALVSERGLYSEDNVEKGPNEDEEETVVGKVPNSSLPPKPHNILGQFHEDALTQVNFPVCAY